MDRIEVVEIEGGEPAKSHAIRAIAIREEYDESGVNGASGILFSGTEEECTIKLGAIKLPIIKV